MENVIKPTVLRIDASARRDGSITRGLNDRVINHMTDTAAPHVITRDLADNPLPQITEDWIGANFTPDTERTEHQRALLAQSDTLVAEIEAADLLVIGLPIYNFGIPAALKAWVDLVARAGRTFRYTADGPVGLLTGKRAIVTVASGGTQAGSDIDFATGYIRHVLGFLGIEDVDIIAADRMALDPEATLATANATVDQLDRAA